MLIVALVLAVIGLAALVMAVVTSNELIAWVCIAASVVGVVLLIVDALRDRSKQSVPVAADSDESEYVEDYPDEAPIAGDYTAEADTAGDYGADEYGADEYGVDEYGAERADDRVTAESVPVGAQPVDPVDQESAADDAADLKLADEDSAEPTPADGDTSKN